MLFRLYFALLGDKKHKKGLKGRKSLPLLSKGQPWSINGLYKYIPIYNLAR